MNMKNFLRTASIAASAVLAGVGAVLSAASWAAGAAPVTPVYVCPAFAPDCAHAQELVVQDHNGAPIFAVGEYGGAKVFGDKLSVYSGVLTPSVVISHKADVMRGSCASRRELYISPAGMFTCTQHGWVTDMRFPG